MPLEVYKKFLSSIDASTHIGCAANSLKQSRSTGMLMGVKAPAYLKIGYNIRYKVSTLDDWLDQFEEQLSTSENIN